MFRLLSLLIVLLFPYTFAHSQDLKVLLSSSKDLSFIADAIEFYRENEITTLRLLPLGIPIKEYKRVSDRYGYRKDPITGKRKFHSGIDIASDLANIVYASGSGVVEFAGKKGGYGKCVILKHICGYSSLYAHLSYIYVKKGEIVKKGKAVGFVGSTGRSTGNHLHYEVRKNGKPIQPYILIK